MKTYFFARLGVKKIVILVSICILILLVPICTISIKEYKHEQKVAARFDYFMKVFYPYLEEYYHGLEVYTKMELSIKQCPYKEDLYIDDEVKYYDDSGRFKVKEQDFLWEKLVYLQALFVGSRASSILKVTPKHRRLESSSYHTIVWCSLMNDNLAYNDNIDIDSAATYYQNALSEMRKALDQLEKYKVYLMKINVDDIHDSYYDLENY